MSETPKTYQPSKAAVSSLTESLRRCGGGTEIDLLLKRLNVLIENFNDPDKIKEDSTDILNQIRITLDKGCFKEQSDCMDGASRQVREQLHQRKDFNDENFQVFLEILRGVIIKDTWEEPGFGELLFAHNELRGLMNIIGMHFNPEYDPLESIEQVLDRLNFIKKALEKLSGNERVEENRRKFAEQILQIAHPTNDPRTMVEILTANSAGAES